MDKIIIILIAELALMITSCNSPEILHSSNKTEILIEDLDTPWSIDFLPDSRMVFTQRNGKVAIYDGEKIAIIGQIQVNEISESGLLGIAVDPEFEDNKQIYLYYTDETANRVSRFNFNETMLTDEIILLDGIPYARFHNGGRIKFGPDGLLYITTGDATMESSAQDINSLSGKILRMRKDGSIPNDNPFENYVYSYGHRNPQGLIWDDNGNLFSSEHGPNRHDEINIISKGNNYGWPMECGDNERYVQPIRCYTEFTLAPSGIAYYNNSLFIAGLRGTQIRKIDIISNGSIVAEDIFIDDYGRIRDVVYHEGFLYIATNNKDGRGVPRQGDDKIIRIMLN